MLQYGAAHHWQYGRDALFTYGPLGYLHCSAHYAADTVPVSVVYQILFKAFYVGLICRLCRALPRNAACLFLLAATFLPMVDDDSIYLLTIGFAALLLCGTTRADRVWALAATAIVAVSTLIKGTFLVYACVTLGCVGAHFAAARRWRDLVWLVVVFTGCFLTADIWFAKQDLGNLPAFLRLSLEVVGGYSQAMNLAAPFDSTLGSMIIAVLVFGRLAALALRSPAPAGRKHTLLLILGIGLFLAWKAGFTRSDFAHQPTFFLYALTLAAAGPVFFPSREGAPVGNTSSVSSLVPAIALWVTCSQAYSGNHYPPLDRIAANLGWLLTPGEQTKMMDDMVKARARRLDLPSFRATIGPASTDMFGCLQVVLLANGFNYQPPPVFHGYNAYSPRLVELNTAYYRSSRAPEFVMFSPFTIDGRFPNLDNAGVLLELLRNYQPAGSEKGFLLLRKGSSGRDATEPTAVPMAEGYLGVGETLRLPKGSGPVWCSLDLWTNAPGSFMATFYQSPVFNMRVFTPGKRSPDTYRLVPGMSRAGFLLSPMVASPSDFLRLQTGKPADNQQVEAIQIVDDPATNWLLRLPVHYHLYSLPMFAHAGELPSKELPGAEPDPGRVSARLKQILP